MITPRFILLALCLLGQLLLADSDPYVPPTPEEKKLALEAESIHAVKIRVECFRMPRNIAQMLIIGSKNSFTLKANINRVRAAIEAKEAGYALIATGAIIAHLDKHCKMENVDEVIYPTAYEGDGKEKKNPQAQEIATEPEPPERDTSPVTISAEVKNNNLVIYKDEIAARAEAIRQGVQLLVPTDFEMQQVGFNFDVEPILGNNNKTLDIEIDFHFVRLVGWTLDKGAIQPMFDAHEFRKDLILNTGEAVILGAWTPRAEDIPPNSNLVDLMVMEADIVQ